MEPPYIISYAVTFQILGKNEGRLEPCRKYKFFEGPDPLEARKEAFQAMEEYLSWLGQEGIFTDHLGNEYIKNPDNLPASPTLNRDDNLESISKKITDSDQYQQRAEVLLIIGDDVFKEEIGTSDPLPLYTVSAEEVDGQELVLNLQREFDLYHHCGIDVSKDALNIRHYADYYAEFEDDDMADYNILPSPFNWTDWNEYEGQKRMLENLRKIL